MEEFSVTKFDKGLITQIEDHSIDESAASSSLNWLTLGDKIELTGGYTILGNENTGTGKITGLKVCKKVDGTEIILRTRGKKIEYLSGTTWTEIGTDQLGTDANGEDVAITSYTSMAGYQAWISSPNSSLYKLMLANPGNILDMYDVAKNFKGYIEAQDNGLYMWGIENAKNSFRRSWKDLQNTTVYTSINDEAVGVSGSQTYTGTLATVSGKKTCFGLQFTDGTQTIQDDSNGTCFGDGTGTINYVTGVFSITFDAVTTGDVVVDYQTEDCTVQGLADFTFTVPTRIAAEGFTILQPSGGDLLNVYAYNSEKYCIHEDDIWLFTLANDDTTVSNTVYRVNIGSTNWRGGWATGDGIYFVDETTKDVPRLKLLTLESTNNKVIPQIFSYSLDLSGYDFSSAAVFEWGSYLLFACKTTGASANNRIISYNKEWNAFDVMDYCVSLFDEYEDGLIAGDSLSNNVFNVFTGFSANGSVIQNYWEGKLSKLEIEELKKFKRLTIHGQIGKNQSVKVSLAYDGANFVEVGTIDGDGSYVSTSPSAVVGSEQVGVDEIGGGGTGILAYDFVKEIRIRSNKFDQVKIRFEATDVGYASVSEINFYDIKTYGQKNLLRFRTTS